MVNKEKKKMKKILIFTIIVLSIGVCGCMWKYKSSNNAIAYLKEKYGQDFTFDSWGNDVWSSKTETSFYKDNDGRLFSVKRRGNDFSDNYCSVLYDYEIQNHFNSLFKETEKVFVSTNREFFGITWLFKDYKDYMEKCSVINLELIIILEENIDEIANTLLIKANNSTAYVIVYRVSESIFNNLTQYSNQVDLTDVIQVESFWIRDGSVNSKSWGNSDTVSGTVDAVSKTWKWLFG